MAKLSPTVQACVTLRQAQVSAFARKPRHKGDRGFEIVPADNPHKLTERDQKVSDYVFDFLMNSGTNEAWERKRLPSLLRAVIRDLLVIGAITIELVYDEDGKLSELWAIDAATIELQWAERYIPTTRYGKDMDQPVRYVQVVDGQIETEYAEDELIYAELGPMTDISEGGYPLSPTRAAADWVAAEILALQYNSNYFDHGSVPPGVFVLIGNYSEDTLDAMNTMWETDVKGVVGQHKPVALALDPGPNGGGSANWFPMKSSNRDMEMGDFLDKLTTKISSIFLTDPIEIGQRTASNSGGASMSDNTEAKIDLSRDKGLVPILDLIEEIINHHVMPHLAPGYVFRFTGINAEDEQEKVEFLNGQRGITYREWRKAMGLDEEPPNYKPEDTWLDSPMDEPAQKLYMAAKGIGAPPMGDEEGDGKPPLKAIPGGKKPPAPKEPVEHVEKSWAAY